MPITVSPKTQDAVYRAIGSELDVEALSHALIQAGRELCLPVVIERDAPIRNFLDCDYGFINQPLASHYGLGDLGDPARAHESVQGAQGLGILGDTAFAVGGGLVAFGIVGIFVGPVILAIAYTLLDNWVAVSEPVTPLVPDSTNAT